MRKFYIGGINVYVSPSWNITDRINSRTTLSLTVIDALGAMIEPGVLIEFYDDLELTFSGVVIDVQKYENFGKIEYNLSAVDNTALADKVRIAKVYNAELAGDIVRDIITRKLSAEGVTSGTIHDGFIIKKAVFNYIKCSEALDYLANITGLIWFIDNGKSLHFIERATFVAPFDLTDTTHHYGFKQTSTLEGYRNRQYLRGGKGLTDLQAAEIPTPKPDGKSRSFIVRFPLAEKPIIELSLSGTGWIQVSPDDIGVNGLDKDKKWYFSYGSQIITQSESEAILVDADAIRLSYKGLRNLFLSIDDPIEIEKRKTIEGGSGFYEDLAIENTLNDTAQAIQYGNALLQKYGEVKDTITYNTNLKGLRAGQIQRVKKRLYGINGNFLIEYISIRPDGKNRILYSVKALDGASLGGWEQFFKTLVKSQKDLVISENEVIINLNQTMESRKRSGILNVKVFSPPKASEDLVIPFVIGGTVMEEYNVSD